MVWFPACTVLRQSKGQMHSAPSMDEEIYAGLIRTCWHAGASRADQVSKW